MRCLTRQKRKFYEKNSLSIANYFLALDSLECGEQTETAHEKIEDEKKCFLCKIIERDWEPSVGWSENENKR